MLVTQAEAFAIFFLIKQKLTIWKIRKEIRNIFILVDFFFTKKKGRWHLWESSSLEEYDRVWRRRSDLKLRQTWRSARNEFTDNLMIRGSRRKWFRRKGLNGTCVFHSLMRWHSSTCSGSSVIFICEVIDHYPCYEWQYLHHVMTSNHFLQALMCKIIPNSKWFYLPWSSFERILCGLKTNYVREYSWGEWEFMKLYSRFAGYFFKYVFFL